MERYCRRNQRPVGPTRCAKAVLFAKARCVAGQATVEYALVLAGFLAVVIGLGALAGVLREGLFVDHALASASHHIGGSVAALLDVLMF